jgi:hypothetical protein
MESAHNAICETPEILGKATRSQGGMSLRKDGITSGRIESYGKYYKGVFQKAIARGDCRALSPAI